MYHFICERNIKMKKVIALVLTFILLMSVMVFAEGENDVLLISQNPVAEFKDMPNDWSTDALKAAVKNGLLTGSNGYIKAGDNMTRAEMATIMVRACAATDTADISAFTDVKESDWYFDSMSKAVAMGAFSGSGNKLNPENPITRQEAFLVLTRVFGLNSGKINTRTLNSFKDANKISDWAKEGVASIVSSGYVAGSDGYINPLNNISRAEFAVVMDRLIKYYIDDFSDDIPEDGNMMIRIPATKLEGLKTDKMVVLGDGMGNAEITLNDNTLTGKLVVRGGKNVKLYGGSYEDIAVVKAGISLDASSTKAGSVYGVKGSKINLPRLGGN